MFCPPGGTVLEIGTGSGSLGMALFENDAPGRIKLVTIEENDYQYNNAVSRWKRLADKPSSIETLHADAAYEQEYLTRSGPTDGNTEDDCEE